MFSSTVSSLYYFVLLLVNSCNMSYLTSTLIHLCEFYLSPFFIYPQVTFEVSDLHSTGGNQIGCYKEASTQFLKGLITYKNSLNGQYRMDRLQF